MMNEQRIVYLLEGHLYDHLSPEEKNELASILEVEKDNTRLAVLMEEVFIKHREGLELPEPDTPHMWNTILQDDRVHTIALNKRSRLRPLFYYVSAAVACCLLVFGLYFYLKEQPTIPVEKFKNVVQTEPLVSPGREQATLTLPSGEVVALEDLAQGKVLQTAAGRVRFEDGQIKIDADDAAPISATTTLRTPQGGEYHMILSDGTSVWLNAGSSITYPLAFQADRRDVTITGEVFFEVTKDANRPFTVHAEGTSVRVLGTSFNVSAYPEDKTIRTTLIEGRVQMQKGDAVQHLMPGEQARVGKGESDEILVRTVDVEEAMAWKNGYFYFRQEPIRMAMKKIARWYDVEVVFEGPIPQKGLEGTISRMENLQQLLDALQLTGAAKFSLKGRRVIVRQ